MKIDFKFTLILLAICFSCLTQADPLFKTSPYSKVSEKKCKTGHIWNEQRKYCKSAVDNENSCPVNMFWNVSATSCISSCEVEINAKPIGDMCYHVCNGPEIQGIGKICPDGRPGMTQKNYEAELHRANKGVK